MRIWTKILLDPIYPGSLRSDPGLCPDVINLILAEYDQIKKQTKLNQYMEKLARAKHRRLIKEINQTIEDTAKDLRFLIQHEDYIKEIVKPFEDYDINELKPSFCRG
jgi:replication initiation and membrane attachment protein DnaB